MTLKKTYKPASNLNASDLNGMDYYRTMGILYPSPFKMQVLIRLKNIFTALLNLK